MAENSLRYCNLPFRSTHNLSADLWGCDIKPQGTNLSGSGKIQSVQRRQGLARSGCKSGI